jgi:hypothetical protein
MTISDAVAAARCPPGIQELVTHENMDVFFSLLAFESDLEDNSSCAEEKNLRCMIWDLLQLLPTEPRLQDILGMVPRDAASNSRKGHHVDWEIWLPSRSDAPSTYRLLYALQLVESMASSYTTVTSTSASSSYSGTATAASEAVELELNGSAKTNLEQGNAAVPKAVAANAAEENTDPNVEEHLASDKNEGEEGKALDNWCTRFVQEGGLDHLVHIISTISLTSRADKSEGEVSSSNRMSAKRKDGAGHDDIARHHSSDVGVTVRCAKKLLGIVSFFLLRTENSDSERKRLSRLMLVESFGQHILKLIHWSCCIEVSILLRWDCRLGELFIVSSLISHFSCCVFLFKLLVAGVALLRSKRGSAECSVQK